MFARTVWLMLLSCFFVSYENAITKIFARSLFVSHLGHTHLPMIWFALVPLSTACAFLYARAQKSFSFSKIFAFLLFLNAFINTVFGLFVDPTFKNIFFYYLWKELFPVFIFQSIWGISYKQIHSESGPHFYARMFSFSTLGGIFGSVLCTSITLTTHYRYFCIVNALLNLIIGYKCFQHPFETIPDSEKQLPPSEDIFRQINVFPKKTTGFTWVACSVIIMQVISCLQELLLYEAIEHHCFSREAKEAVFAWSSFFLGCSIISCSMLNAQLMTKWRVSHIHTYCVFALLLCVHPSACMFSHFFHETFVYLSMKTFDAGFLMPSRENFYAKMNPDQRAITSQYINIILYRGSKVLIGAILLLVNDKTTLIIQAKWARFIACIMLFLAYALFNPTYLDYQKKTKI